MPYPALELFFSVDILACDIETAPNGKFAVEEFGMMPKNGRILGVGIYNPAVGGRYCTPDEFEALKPLLETKRLRFHNAKFDVKWLMHNGFNVKDNFDDTILMLDLIKQPMKLGLKNASEVYLGRIMQTYDETIKAEEGALSMGDYCIEDCKATWDLYEFLQPLWKTERQETYYKKVELPLIPVLIGMENEGLFVDQSELRVMDAKLTIKLDALLTKFNELAKVVPDPKKDLDYVMNSTKKLGDLLFPKGLPVQGILSKTPKKSIQVNAEVLEALSEIDAQTDHEKFAKEVSSVILEYRQYLKLKSVYIGNFLKFSSQDGKIHPSFIQWGCATGRLSCKSPNLLNIVKNDEFNLYECFKAPIGYKIISADYSQVELRMLSHISKDPELTDAYLHDKDIHQKTADLVGCSRQFAKVINFSLNYGASAWSLSKKLKVSEEEAERYIDNYFDQYSGVREYQQNQIAYANEHLCVWTICGRRILIREIKSNVRAIRGGAERGAINFPIQASSADVQKIALRKTHDKLPSDCRIILEVHDSIHVLVPESKVDEVSKILKECMESAVKLSVPLKVDISVESYLNESKFKK